MTIHPNLSTQIKEDELEAIKPKNMAGKALRRMERNLEIMGDGVYYFMNRIWRPKLGGFREVVMNEEHKTL